MTFFYTWSHELLHLNFSYSLKKGANIFTKCLTVEKGGGMICTTKGICFCSNCSKGLFFGKFGPNDSFLSCSS